MRRIQARKTNNKKHYADKDNRKERRPHEGVSEGMNAGIERFVGNNSYAFGTSRDNHVVNLIKDGRAFTRSQVEQILITNRKSSKRIAQTVLRRLYRQERIKKKVYAPQLPVVYFVEKPKYMEHTLLINDVYCALLSQKKPWYVIEWKWSYSILNGKAIADAMANIYTEPDRKGRKVFFIEVERNPSKRFNKPEQYQKVYDSDWVKEEWSVIKNNTAIFPAILIVTEEELVIKSDLNFIVASIEQVQKDVYGLIRR